MKASRLLRRAPVLVAFGLALVGFLVFGPKLPRDQSLRLTLGDAAPLVRELGIRYRERDTDEVLREVSFRYPRGEAPRIVHHGPRLADGEYLLEIDLLTLTTRSTVRKTVGLHGGASTVDIATAIREASGPLPASSGAAEAGAAP